jgi:hypothetical protein
MEDWRDIPIDDCEFSVRATNCLKSHFGDDCTLGQIDAVGSAELLRIKHFGRRSLNEVREVLNNVRNPRPLYEPITGMPLDLLYWCAKHQFVLRALMEGEARILLEDISKLDAKN